MINRKQGDWIRRLGVSMALALAIAAGPGPARARKHPPLTNVTVLVTDAVTHKPLFQAQLTLEFRDTRRRTGKAISLSAKTDVQGKYRFSFIPMESVVLVVTAANHQTFGKQFQITRPNQTIEAEMRTPQPLR